MKTVRLKAMRSRCQRGAVAITFAFSLLVLFGFMALVFDLGRTYVVRTELQNAADAAALAGAKELNQTKAGVDAAVARAIAMAGQNNFKFSTPVVITINNISVGTCPDNGSCTMQPASTIDTLTTGPTTATDKTFIKVDIPSGSLATIFARVPTTQGGTGIQETNTFGRAVAGRQLTDVTPIAMCKLSNAAEWGYQRGVSYDIQNVNELLGGGNFRWVDPETPTAPCSAGNADDVRPYICTGKILFTPVSGRPIRVSTGNSTPNLRALDSRFGDYHPSTQCVANTSPADTNVEEYRPTYSGVSAAQTPPVSRQPATWMAPAPTRQSIIFNPDPKLIGSGPMTDFGVLWSASRPEDATVDQWPSLYGGAASNYPEPSPYSIGGGNNRRFLNLIIIDCPTAAGNCQPATVLGTGKFFLQRKVDITGNGHVYLEFGGLLEGAPDASIKLYK